MRRVRTFLIAAAAGLTAVACIDQGAHAEVGVTDDTITIGALGVLTGPLSIYGKTIFDGVETVYDETNKTGGINGRRLVYVREDDHCQPADAIGATKKLIYEDKVFMIHGGACSNASLAAKPEIEAAKIPWLITASNTDSLTDPVNPYIFTTNLAAWMESYVQVKFAVDHGYKRIAIISQHDAWGRARYEPVQAAMTSLSVKPVADEELAPDTNDATAAVLRLRAAKADAVIALLYPKAMFAYLRDASKVGFTPVVTGGTVIGDIDAFGKTVGVPGAIDSLRALAGVAYTPEDPAMAKWKTAVESAYPGSKFSTWHMMGIASGQFLVEALKRAGRDLTRQKIIDVLAHLSMRVDPYGGPLACTPQDHQCLKTVAWFAMIDGKVKQMGTTEVKR